MRLPHIFIHLKEGVAFDVEAEQWCNVPHRPLGLRQQQEIVEQYSHQLFTAFCLQRPISGQVLICINIITQKHKVEHARC